MFTNYSVCSKITLIFLLSIQIQWNSLVRSPILHQKSDLSRGFASRQGLKPIHLCLDLYFQVAFPEAWPLVKVPFQKGFYCIDVFCFHPIHRNYETDYRSLLSYLL